MVSLLVFRKRSQTWSHADCSVVPAPGGISEKVLLIAGGLLLSNSLSFFKSLLTYDKACPDCPISWHGRTPPHPLPIPPGLLLLSFGPHHVLSSNLIYLLPLLPSVPHPCLNLSPTGVGIFIFSLLYPQSLELCWAPSWCSINICWTNEWSPSRSGFLSRPHFVVWEIFHKGREMQREPTMLLAATVGSKEGN